MQSDNEILIDYLDKQLNPEESARVEEIIKKDSETASELQYLQLAINTVRLDAINQRVHAIRKTTGKSQPAEKPASGIIRSMFKNSMRVAAIAILVIGVAVLYKYVSVNDQSVYNKQFVAYELSNMRGTESGNDETVAYQDKNWNRVIEIFKEEKNTSNQAVFLAAMSEMQLNHFSESIVLFKKILDMKSGDMSYREEAEYYLSLSYLMNHEENEALHMIGKIKADPSHTYYPLVSGISALDLKIIDLKK
ncbi:MAG TPA: hypothetical protein VIL90_04860 [Puia sp.]